MSFGVVVAIAANLAIAASRVTRTEPRGRVTVDTEPGEKWTDSLSRITLAANPGYEISPFPQCHRPWKVT